MLVSAYFEGFYADLFPTFVPDADAKQATDEFPSYRPDEFVDTVELPSPDSEWYILRPARKNSNKNSNKKEQND